MADEETSFGIERITDAFNRRKWLTLIVFLCVATVGITGVSYLPEMYRASALVVIEQQVIPDQFVRSTVTTNVETRLQTITEEILSRPRLEEYIEQFDLYRTARDRGESAEALAWRMRGDIEFFFHRNGARNWANAVAFTVGYIGEDREKVADVANFLASLYVDESVKARAEQAQSISRFLVNQLEDVRATLEGQEARLTQFKERHLGELPHQQEANLAGMEQLNAQLEANSARQVEVSAQRQTLLKELAAAQGVTTDSTDPREVQLADLKFQLEQLRSQYTEKHPDVVRLQGEVALLERAISRGGGGGTVELSSNALDGSFERELKSAIAEAEQRLSGLQAEAGRLSERMETYQKRVDNAPRVEQQYQLLSRDYDTTLEQYRSLFDRQKEAELAENMEQGHKGEQMKLVEPAVVPGRPAAPDRPLLYVIALALALALAAGTVLLAEILDSSFHSMDELRLTGFSIVGSIPLIVTDQDRRRKRWVFVLGAACLLLGLAALATGTFLLADGNFELTSLLVL